LDSVARALYQAPTSISPVPTPAIQHGTSKHEQPTTVQAYIDQTLQPPGPTSHPTAPSVALTSPPGAQRLASSPQVAAPPIPATPSSSKGISRRGALGWIISGTVAVGLGVGAGIYFFRQRKPDHAREILKGHTGEVTSLSWSPDGTLLATASMDHTVRLWQANTGRSILRYKGHTNGVFAVAWSSDGAQIASGGKDATVQLWKSQGIPTYQTPPLGNTVSALSWGNADRQLFAGTLGHGLYNIQFATNQAVALNEQSIIHAVATSPDGRYIALGTGSGYVAILELQTAGLRRVYSRRLHNSAVLSLAWSPNSMMLASGGADKTAHISTTTIIAATHVVYTLRHAGAVTGLAWNPMDSGSLAASCTDKTLYLWRIGNQSHTTYSGHSGSITSVAWSQYGLATGSADSTAIIWDAQ
jgi:WD40 repeat protein